MAKLDFQNQDLPRDRELGRVSLRPPGCGVRLSSAALRRAGMASGCHLIAASPPPQRTALHAAFHDAGALGAAALNRWHFMEGETALVAVVGPADHEHRRHFPTSFSVQTESGHRLEK
jgi:hypothetical protein